MKTLITTILILLITATSLYILNDNLDIFKKKSNWPTELNRVPDISQIVKINSLKKEIIDEDRYWYIEIKKINIKEIGQYLKNLKTYNFIFLNDKPMEGNEIEEHHINNNVNVFLKYNPNIDTTKLLITIIIK